MKAKFQIMHSNSQNRQARFAFVVLAYCFLFAVNCFSQSVSELEEKLKTATEEEKPGILNQLAESYLKSDANKAIEYGEQALKASRKIDDVEGITGALINLGSAYDVTKNPKKAVQNYREAIVLFDEYNQPASSAYLWNRIADSYLSAQKYSDALDANTKALDLYKKANDKMGIANMNIDLGDIYFKQQKYEGSLPHYKQALKFYEDSKDAKGQITLLNRIGTSYSQWGNYDESYMFLSRALDLAKKNNLVSQANAISQNIDVVKQNMSNYERSQTEFALQAQKDQQQKAQEQELKIKTKESVISTLSSKNIKSLQEIEQLSGESQLKELKIKAQQEEKNRMQMDADAQAKATELLKKDKELADSALKTQRLIIWGAVGFSLLGIILTALVFAAYRNKKKANNILTQKNDIIYKQKEQIVQKNMLITDSIDYAKSIQEAILPPISMLSKHFQDSFIFYKPKDVVSGDFYWMHEGKDNNSVSVAAADCTGHGVPGAFMSLLGFIMLDDITRANAGIAPNDVLKAVNNQLMSVLHQNNENTTGKFGMDIAIIKYDKQKKEIVFSGAHNPCIVISNGEIREVKGDRVFIGTTLDCSFTSHSIPVKEGDIIYLYSDGFQDQISGEKRKKFLSFHLKELLLQIYTLPLEKQMEELNKKHLAWKGSSNQTDDILIIGLKV